MYRLSENIKLVLLCIVLGLLSIHIGCDWKSSDHENSSGQNKNMDIAHSFTRITLGDMLEEFQAPPLEKLAASVENNGGWISQPVYEHRENLKQFLNQSSSDKIVQNGLLNSTNQSGNIQALPEKEEDVDYDAQLNFYSSYDVKSTNPLLANLTMEVTLQRWTGIQLFEMDCQTFAPYACAEYVSSWETSSDGKIDKIIMRDDLVWSDGTPLTAYDYEFTFQVMNTRGVPVRTYRPSEQTISCVKAYDDKTLVFFHKQAAAVNTLNINIPVIPKHVYEESILKDPSMQLSDYHRFYENNPITSGPYCILQHKSEQSILLEARENYYRFHNRQVRPRPFCKRIHYKISHDREVAVMALKRADIDFLSPTPTQFISISQDSKLLQQIREFSADSWSYGYFAWNIKTPFFSDVRVRKAMAYVFDYNEMFHTILNDQGKPSRGLFMESHPSFPVSAQPPYHQDIDKAAELLKEAGWEDSDGNGILDKNVNGEKCEFKFSLSVSSSNTTGLQICELLKQCLMKIGIHCTINKMEYAVLVQQTLQHQFQGVFLNGTNLPDPVFEEINWVSNASNNICCYSNPEVDRLFQEGRTMFDRSQRLKLYGQIHNILYEEQPYTFLFRSQTYFVCGNRIRGCGSIPTRVLFEAFWIPKKQE